MHFTGHTELHMAQPLQWSKSIPTTSGFPFCFGLSGQYRKHSMQLMHLLNSIEGLIALQLPVLNFVELPPSALAPMLI
jgi:hypothetical protein